MVTWSTNLIFNVQPAPGASGTVWAVENTCHSGMSIYRIKYASGNLTLTHFVRDETLRIMGYLTSQFSKQQVCLAPYYKAFPRANISGTSGAGKSTEVWGWLGAQNGRKLWVHHLHDSGVYRVVRWRAAGIQSATMHSVNEVVTEIGGPGVLNYDIVALDGSFADQFIVDIHLHLVDMHDATTHFPLIVICASGRGAGSLPGELHLRFNDGEVMRVHGFSKAEYMTARGLLDITGETAATRAAYVDNLFYFTGGSGRLFFEWEGENHVKGFIRNKLELVGDVNLLLNDAERPEVSLLDYISNDTTVLVSEYVSRALSKYVDYAIIDRVKKWNSLHPTWQGWVAKLEMLWIARQCLATREEWNLKLKNDRAIKKRRVDFFSYHISDIVDYQSLDDVTAVRAAALVAGISTLFIPECWNKDAFDAVLVVCPSVAASSAPPATSAPSAAAIPYAFFIQCTLATTHSHNVENCAAFLQALWPLPAGRTFRSASPQNITTVSVQYVIATTLDNCNAFTMGAPTNAAFVHNFDSSFGASSMKTTYFNEDAVNWKL